MELAYRLAVSEKPEIQAIRKNTIVLITPVTEPDGRDRQVEWYYRHLKRQEAAYEELDESRSPPYWGHYVLPRQQPRRHAGHPGAHPRHPRDLLRLPSAGDARPPRVGAAALHLDRLRPLQPGDRPGDGQRVDPARLPRGRRARRAGAAGGLDRGASGTAGGPAISTRWPTTITRWAASTRPSATARPAPSTATSRGPKFAGKPVTDVQWYRPCAAGQEAPLVAAQQHQLHAGRAPSRRSSTPPCTAQELLENFWTKGDRALEKGKTEAPYAWVFPPEQRDPGPPRLSGQPAPRSTAIEVHRLTAEAKIWAARAGRPGSYVVRMDQPYRNAGGQPPGGAEVPGRRAEPALRRRGLDLAAPLRRRGRGGRRPKVLDGADGAGRRRRRDPVGTGRRRGRPLPAARHRARRRCSRPACSSARTRWTRPRRRSRRAASPIRRGAGSSRRRARRWRRSRGAAGLSFAAAAAAARRPPPRRRPAAPGPAPQLDLDTQDAGWARYTLDREQARVHADQRRRPEARRTSPSASTSSSSRTAAAASRTWCTGSIPSYGPLAYTRTPEFPSHGIPDASDDITGGMGFEGLMNLHRFVRGGGVLIAARQRRRRCRSRAGWCAGSSRVPPGGFNTPGSEVRAKVRAAGAPARLRLRGDDQRLPRQRPGLRRGRRPDRGRVVLQFGTKKAETDARRRRRAPPRPGPARRSRSRTPTPRPPPPSRQSRRRKRRRKTSRSSSPVSSAGRRRSTASRRSSTCRSDRDG